MSAITEWINGLPEGSEKDYFSKLLELLHDFDIRPDDKNKGLALIFFLERCDIVSSSLNTVEHPAAGSLFDNSLFVSHLFYEVNRNAYQWKNDFLSIKDDAPFLMLIDWWKTKFKESGRVTKVLC